MLFFIKAAQISPHVSFALRLFLDVKALNTNHYFTLQYNIKKKEEVMPEEPMMPDNPLMRKKKTPEELAAEAEAEDQDDFTSE